MSPDRIPAVRIWMMPNTAVLRLIFPLLLAAAFVLAAMPAQADIGADVAGLAAKGYKAKGEAVERLATSGDARAVPVLRAYLEQRLFRRKSDDRLVIGEKSGKIYHLLDPLSLAALGEAGKRDLRKVKINNKLRGMVRGALGRLSLMDPDPDRRVEAADAVFKTRPRDMVPVLELALASEDDAPVAARIERALAATRLATGGETEIRVAALDVLAKFPDRDVRALINGLLLKNDKGEPVEPDAAVRDAAAGTLVEIERSIAFWSGLGNVFQGLSLGSVLLLAAIGLAITFGVMGVINMAHGEMVMLGAYTTYVVQEVFRTHMPGGFDYSLAVAVPLAFLVAGAVGIAIERGIIRFLYGRPLETLLATWGLSLILQQLVRTVFGPTNREVGNPSWMSGAVEVAGGLTLTYNRIWIIVFSLCVLAGLMLLMRKTGFGLQMRAVTQNRRMAASMGIRTGLVDALTFGLGSGIAGMAGVALSQIDNVSPNLGQSYIIDSFLVVVFGGVGNLWGTLVGAFSLGLLNKFLEPYAGAVLGKILVLVLIILFIQKRPRGLFALKGRAVES